MREHIPYMLGRLTLALVFASGCGEPPRCVLRIDEATLEVHGGAESCETIEQEVRSAVTELSVPFLGWKVPSGSIHFRDTETWARDGETLRGTSLCFPFSMELGNGPLPSLNSSLAHELAHWARGVEKGHTDCAQNDGEGGHHDWKARGIYAAIERWSKGQWLPSGDPVDGEVGAQGAAASGP